MHSDYIYDLSIKSLETWFLDVDSNRDRDQEEELVNRALDLRAEGGNTGSGTGTGTGTLTGTIGGDAIEVRLCPSIFDLFFMSFIYFSYTYMCVYVCMYVCICVCARCVYVWMYVRAFRQATCMYRMRKIGQFFPFPLPLSSSFKPFLAFILPPPHSLSPSLS